MNQEKNICVECESEYYKDSSKMACLCPDCAYQLYQYPNCLHKFENGNCVKCGWNGQTSEYLKNRTKEMEIKTHKINTTQIAELISDAILINNDEDSLNLLGNLYYQGFDKMILHQKNITPHFFDLKNGMAGEILQKFSNYRMSLLIIGDFSELTQQSKSLKDFIYESNKGKQVNFISSIEEAVEKLAK
ncbi:DUF4180 domain-containing protein [Bernardetia sp. Wsw4-3y2]|uniref:DUF4180 domain-containing protein n=1 Tax=Bernardetia sp. Wsw4-3y2 TaxID=3127471 RepID=UPI0030D4809F